MPLVPDRNYLVPLEGRVAVVTGASRGIGRWIATELARAGVQLCIVARNRQHLDALADELVAHAVDVLVHPADLTDPEAPARVISETVSRFGRLDILVNNAGMGLRASVEKTSTDMWDLHMNLNARAPFLLCRSAVSHLRRSDAAAVVNIASVVSNKGYEHQAAYTASKHALLGFSKVLARELNPEGIRVHTLCPGGVATEMVGEMRPDLEPSALIQPEEIADLVLFLISRRGNAVVDNVNIRRSSSEPWK
jgi:3-oxoacyl-[acyl-carrier protein] reductase